MDDVGLAGVVVSSSLSCDTLSFFLGSIDCLYSNTAHMVIEFSSDVLPPGGKMEVPITFYPRAAILYQEMVVFQLNGHSRQDLRLQGQGIEMKVWNLYAPHW